MSCRADGAGAPRTYTGASNAGAAAAVHQPDQLDEPPQLTNRQIEDELDVVTNRNTTSVDIAAPFSARLGDPGVNRLIVRDSVAGGAFTIGNAIRVGVDVHLLDLDSGTPDGRSGYRFGSLPRGATYSRQQVSGWAADVEVSGTQVGVAFGVSPTEFPVRNWTGGVRLGSPDGSLRVVMARDAVKDSLLSWAGARDPGTGIVWGGVVSDSGTLHFNRSESGSGQYVSVGASYLHGTNVADNWSAQATAGAFWRVADSGHGGLAVGVNATGTHYNRNLNFFSIGHGGYFSPQRYVLGSIPISWFERRARVEYEIAASGGVQSISQDGAPFDPMRRESPEASYDPDTRRGANYNLSLRLDYHVAAHVYLGAIAGANNARDFASRTFQITVKCLLGRVPAGTHLPVKAIPDWKGHRPLIFD